MEGWIHRQADTGTNADADAAADATAAAAADATAAVAADATAAAAADIGDADTGDADAVAQLAGKVRDALPVCLEDYYHNFYNALSHSEQAGSFSSRRIVRPVRANRSKFV